MRIPLCIIQGLVLVLFAAAVPSAHAATIRELYEQAVDSYNRKDYGKAVDLYQQITKEAPHFAPAYVGIGLALRAKGGDMDEVLYYYKTATEMDPTNVQAFEQLGRLYYTLNKFDKAERAFLRALKIDPGLTDVKLSLGWIYLLGRSKPERAIGYFKDVIAKAPTPNAYFGLGMAYFADNRRTEAMDIITRLRNTGSDDLADQLEQMVRENRRIALNEAEQADEVSPAAATATPVDPEDQPSRVQQTGMRVRLRGKLSDVQ